MLKPRTQNDQTTIYVDKREPEHIYEEILYLIASVEKFMAAKNFIGFTLVNKQIPVGDLVCGNLVGERKEINDFVGSIYDGRVWKQVKKMAKNYRYGFFLVSGSPSEIDPRRAKAVYTCLADMELRYNIRTMFFDTDEMLCYYFVTLCRKLTGKLNPSLEMLRDAPQDEDVRMRMVRGIPFFGKILAKVLLNRFLSIHEICHATPEQLQELDGIGEVRAKKVWNIMNKKRPVVDKGDVKKWKKDHTKNTGIYGFKPKK